MFPIDGICSLMQRFDRFLLVSRISQPIKGSTTAREVHGLTLRRRLHLPEYFRSDWSSNAENRQKDVKNYKEKLCQIKLSLIVQVHFSKKIFQNLLFFWE